MIRRTRVPGAIPRWTIIALGICTVARGQTTQPITTPDQLLKDPRLYRAPPAPAFFDHPASDFRRGMFAVSLAGAGMTLDDSNHDSLGFIRLGGEYFLSRNTSANLEFDMAPGTLKCGNQTVVTDADGLQEYQSNDSYNLRAYGGLLLLRTYPIRKPNYAIYLDGGFGGLHGHSPYPPQSGKDDWMQAIGGGIALRASANAWWYIGARYVRLSTDFFPSRSSYGFSGIQYYVGINFRL